MAIAVAPWENRNEWWNKRARQNNGISLDDAIRQFKPNSNNTPTNVVYVLTPRLILAPNAISNVMTPEMEAHMADADKFSQWYANRGIEQRVENAHAGFFERAVNTAYSTIANGIKNLAGKAVSVIPTPVRRYAPAGSLAGMLILTACNGKGNDFPNPTPTPQAQTSLFSDFPLSVASASYDGNTGLLHGSLTLKNTTPHAFTTQYRTIVMDNSGNWQRVSEWATNPQFISFDPNEIVNVPFSIGNAKQDTNFMVQIQYTINRETKTFNYTREAIEKNFGHIGFVGPTVTPAATTVPATATPAITNSYDLAKSLGLEASYLKDVAFDANSRGLVTYLASLPAQMRSIAERSGLLEQILADKQIDAKEAVFFKGLMSSYQKEIQTLQPWLSQLSEREVTDALALNLRNFREADKKGELFYSLKGEKVPVLLSPGIFFADGKERKYEDEILDPEAFKTGAINAYAAAAIKNITNFSEIQKKAWEVANDATIKHGPSTSTDLIHQGYFQGEAVGSTDKGQNAYLDMKALWEEGSPEAKTALRIYARNLGGGRKGSAPQVRVPLTMIDAWSLGIDSIGVVLEGHDVPTIPISDKDIVLLNTRSPDPLLVVDVNGVHHLPLQWTRKTAVREDITTLTQIYVYVNGPGGIEYKLADLKPY